MRNSTREHAPAPDHSRHDDLGHNRPVSDKLHPYVYIAIVGLGLWYVVSAWAGFVAEGDIAYLLAVVSGLFLITIAIPCALWLAWRTSRDPHAPKQHTSFRDWASGNFRTWQGDLKASSAAVQILLPIAAVAFGMTAFAAITRAIELGII
jgi:hypothetical protein